MIFRDFYMCISLRDFRIHRYRWGGAYGSLYAFCEVYQVPNGTEIAEGEMKYACFQLCLENACFEFHLYIFFSWGFFADDY